MKVKILAAKTVRFVRSGHFLILKIRNFKGFLRCVDSLYIENINLLIYILCSSQTRLRPLPVQTQGTQLLQVFIQLY